MSISFFLRPLIHSRYKAVSFTVPCKTKKHVVIATEKRCDSNLNIAIAVGVVCPQLCTKIKKACVSTGHRGDKFDCNFFYFHLANRFRQSKTINVIEQNIRPSCYSSGQILSSKRKPHTIITVGVLPGMLTVKEEKRDEFKAISAKFKTPMNHQRSIKKASFRQFGK